jgi:hypothetical protein
MNVSLFRITSTVDLLLTRGIGFEAMIHFRH